MITFVCDKCGHVEALPSSSSPPQKPAEPTPPSAGPSPAAGEDTTTAAGQSSTDAVGTAASQEAVGQGDAAPAATPTDLRAKISEALAFASESLRSRFALRLKGRAVADLTDTQAQSALQFLNAELDKVA